MNTANQKEGILMKKNFYMDLLLFVSGLVCIITDVHTYSGYIMMVGLIFHLVWHWKWIKAVAKKQIGH